jgi:hypothetical protein
MGARKVGWEDMDWTGLVQDGERRRALVNAVMNLGFFKMRGISRLAEELLAFQEGFFSMN